MNAHVISDYGHLYNKLIPSLGPRVPFPIWLDAGDVEHCYAKRFFKYLSRPLLKYAKSTSSKHMSWAHDVCDVTHGSIFAQKVSDLIKKKSPCAMRYEGECRHPVHYKQSSRQNKVKKRTIQTACSHLESNPIVLRWSQFTTAPDTRISMLQPAELQPLFKQCVKTLRLCEALVIQTYMFCSTYPVHNLVNQRNQMHETTTNCCLHTIAAFVICCIFLLVLDAAARFLNLV